MNQSSNKILVINTGGTITMAAKASGELQASKGEVLVELIEDLTSDLCSKIEVKPLQLSNGEVIGTSDSSEIGPTHYDAMAAMIIRENDDYDGFVILHGTDTMSYTASALSFALAQNNKPVVITGAQVPLSKPGSDGLQNLRLALFVADQAGKSLPQLTEVMICFAGQLFRGNRSRKSSTRSAIGFSTPNAQILGELFPVPTIFAEQLRRQPNSYPPLNSDSLGFSDKVLSINLSPGFSGEMLLKIIEGSDIEGLVVRVFGSGTAPNNFNLAEVVQEAKQRTGDRFKCAVIVTDVYNGSLDIMRYAAGKNLRSEYIIDGRDMTPEAATTKLMWVLGSAERKKQLVKILGTAICGEMSGQ
ncbi:asparaginase [Thalassotalea sp. HSM 43]|uniref:asparaginase n=1 Tax=Thalassotalea sp. HSM 43 TaxID=2552945 RepID=UPI0010813EFD|nr:asparaginase [Thalassotalea sp. HSM 43]QBY04315.1 asparaginase [Thalassotalea sp. HSM 43]